MDGGRHVVVGELSWESLSPTDQREWGLSHDIPEDAPDFIKRRLSPPKTVKEKIGQYSLFLDMMGWQSQKWLETPEYLLPGSRQVPHGSGDYKLRGCATSSFFHDPESLRVVLRHFILKVVEQIGRGNMEKAALFAGLLAHFIQDGATPGHIFPNSMFYEFSPEETKTHYPYHSMMDCCKAKLEKAKPCLLGTSVPETVFRLGMLMEENVTRAKRILFPLLEACRKKNSNAMKELLRPPFQSAVFCGASLLHTVLAIGRDSFDAGEIEALKDYSLVEAIPYNCHPGGKYRCIMRGNSVVDDERVPLRVDLGKGPETITDGIGLTSFFAARYLLEKGVFSRLEGQVVLSSDYRQDQDPKMDVEFFVGIDEDYNCDTSPDLKYGPGMKKIYSLKLKPDTGPQRFSLKLGDAKTLLIAAISHPEIVNGEERCYFPHIVVAEPRLLKRIK